MINEEILKVSSTEQKLEKLKESLKYKTKNLKHNFDLGVVCCYFNPCRYKNLLHNYKLFRLGMKKANVRFLTVELAFGNQDFELKDFSEVIFLRSNDVFFHKERLLNIGILKLIKEGHKKIAWFDADIIFKDFRWAGDLSEALEKYPVCQAFDYVSMNKNDGCGENYYTGSVKYFQDAGKLSYISGLPGFGWGVRADILKKILLYDRAILGEGDALFFFGLYYYNKNLISQIKKKELFSLLNDSYLKHYFKWAKKCGSIVKGNVGYIKQSIKTLYHGSALNRQYVTKTQIYRKYNYNPEKDLILNRKTGILGWSAGKKDLHSSVENYFKSRKEDDYVEDFLVSEF